MEKLRPIALWLLLLWLGFATMPAPPGPGGTGLDASWIWGLQIANENGLVFGRDIGVTYGPLGYLTAAAMPDTPSWDNFAFLAMVYALHWFCFWRFSSPVTPRKTDAARGVSETSDGWVKPHPLRSGPALAALAALVCFTLSPYPWDQFELSMLMLAASILYLRSRDAKCADTAAVCLLAFIAGFAWLARLHQGIGAMALLLSVLLYRSPRMHWWLAPLTMVGSFLGFWIAKGQPLSAAPAYLYVCFQLVAGYNEAMALAGPTWPVLTALAAIGATVALSVWASDLAVLPAVALFCGLAFKHGLVREGGHTSPMHLKIAAATLLAGMAVREARRWKWFAALAVANLALGLYITNLFTPYLIDNLRHRLSTYYPRAWVEAYGGYAAFARQMAIARVPVLAPKLLDAPSREKLGNASVDIFPFSIDVVKANRLRWSPRPVFQSYQAFNPSLDGWNAEHYRGSRRPDFVVLHWDPFDRRHHWFDDPLTWRELMGRYVISGPSNQGLILKREGRGLADAPLGPRIETAWNQWQEVPESAPGGWVAAKIDVSPNVWGRLTTLLLRAVPVMMDLEFADGSPAMTIRTVRANLVSGPLVSLMPNSLDEAARAWQGTAGSGLRRVKRLRLWTAAESRYDSRIALQWIAVTRQQ